MIDSPPKKEKDTDEPLNQLTNQQTDTMVTKRSYASNEDIWILSENCLYAVLDAVINHYSISN